MNQPTHHLPQAIAIVLDLTPVAQDGLDQLGDRQRQAEPGASDGLHFSRCTCTLDARP